MNREAALTILGLEGNEDRVMVARAYGERLAALREQLMSAQSEVECNAHGAQLAELGEAYEMLTGTGRYANSNEAVTVIRSGTMHSPASSADAFVLMEPGAVIADRLEIGAMLGEGGMGCVYAARDRLKGEDVAIKVLRHDLQFSDAAKDRFLAEAKISCSLSHPNIVRVHDVGISGGIYYLSMERLKGHTLRHQIDQYRKENRTFRIAEVTDIAHQLIDALNYAHRYIMHRDIKPENIWLAEDGTVKLMDFGIARASSNSQMTKTGVTVGTAYYVSPEQRAGSKEVDWRTDQYALGVVLYELLAGTLPTGAVQPIDTIRRDLPKRYADALMRAMAPSPRKRLRSYNEMLVEMQLPRSKPFRFAGMVLIGAGLAAAGYAVWNGPDSKSKLSAVATALKAELAGTSASAAAEVVPFDAGGTDGLMSVEVPPPEETSWVATALAEPESQSESKIVQVPDPEPKQESQPNSESATGLEAQPRSEPEQLPDSVVKSEPKPEPSLQTPAQWAEAVSATLPTGSTEQTAAITPSSSQSSLSVDAGINTRREQCIAQCKRDNGECRSLSGRGKQECTRAVAGGKSVRKATANAAATSCAYFEQSRCDSASDHDACLARMTTKRKVCVKALGASGATRRQDCTDRARKSDQLCAVELQDCRQSCQ
jgi:serine/threonine protein kinase